MKYFAVNDRCAVNLESLNLLIGRDETLRILSLKGFEIVNIDLISLARECIANSKYQRGARLFDAPAVVDCSSLIKWLYGMRGIWLPRRSIQQRELGEVVSRESVVAGDVIFVSGWIDYYIDDHSDGVGHVGIATGEGTVIHAAGRDSGVIESSLDSFVGETKLRGVRRYIPVDLEVLTFKTPINREVEMSDDLRWIVLQSL
jgi:hypothetical protein